MRRSDRTDTPSRVTTRRTERAAPLAPDWRADRRKLRVPVSLNRKVEPGEDVTAPYTFYADLAQEAPIPARGILSQTLSDERALEFLLFAFAAGEQLSEHTSARPAINHILAGEGELTVGGDAYPACPGTWLRMAPEVKHSLVARPPMQMALYLLPR